MIIIIQQINFLILYPHIFFLPHFTQPTRIRDSSKILIDNTHRWKIPYQVTATISDHLPQFIILSSIFFNPLSNKSNIYERNWSNFFQENFILDYFSVDWNYILNDDKVVYLSFNNFSGESMLF